MEEMGRERVHIIHDKSSSVRGGNPLHQLSRHNDATKTSYLTQNNISKIKNEKGEKYC